MPRWCTKGSAVRKSGWRLDERDEKIGYKIREAQQVGRVPYMLVIGAKEAEEGNISVRHRDTNQTTVMSLDDFVEQVTRENRERL